MKKRYLSFLIILCMVLTMLPGMAFAEEVTTLSGSGTSDAPYTISSVDELVFFRNKVNSGDTKYNAENVYVALGKDIDLAGIDWSVNIGDDCNVTFDGIFDGKGHTISNLSSTETAQKGDEYICTGLFGAIYGAAVVKNLTIENVNINTGSYTGNNVGAVVGFAYEGTGSVENVTVCGDINISASGAYGVGAIVGYAYKGSLKISGCKVDGKSGSSISSASGAGAIIGYSGGSTEINNCTVQDVAINGAGLVGGVAGIIVDKTSASGNTVKNVDLTASGSNWKSGIGIVAGTMASDAMKVTGTTYSNVTANGEDATVIVGSTYAEHPIEPVPAVAAHVNGVYYTSLAEAIKKAASGDTVTLNADVEISETIEIPAGKEITLDLAGHTLQGTQPDESAAYSVIVNKGTLTITGKGKVKCESISNSTAFAVNTITNAGDLTIDGVAVENNGTGSQIGYAIDNNSGTGDAKVTVKKGSSVTASGSAYFDGIRQFCNSTENENSVNIEGGSVSSLWLQNPSDGSGGKDAKDVKGSFSISGGEVGGVYLEPSTEFDGSISGGEIGSVSSFSSSEGRDLTGFISGGIFEEKPEADFIVPNAAAAEVSVDDEEVYAIGKDSIKEAANAGDKDANVVVEVTQGSPSFDSKDLPDGTKLTNSGNGEVKLDGEEIAAGKSVVVENDDTPTQSTKREDISVWYVGGNTFESDKVETPTSVEIDGVPVKFSSNGGKIVVSCISPSAKRITVRWYSTSYTLSFKPDAAALCTQIGIPKTGDVSVIGYALTAIAAAGAMLRKK